MEKKKSISVEQGTFYRWKLQKHNGKHHKAVYPLGWAGAGETVKMQIVSSTKNRGEESTKDNRFSDYFLWNVNKTYADIQRTTHTFSYFCF